MNISELKTGMSDISVTAEVTEVSEPRDVQTKYGPNSVADATLKDDSGSIKLSLWGKQISTVRQGDKIELSGGYVREWNGELQLGIGKSGEIKVL